MDHEGERPKDALAAAWSRIQATRLALDLTSSDARGAAVTQAPTERTDAVPQRLEELVAKRGREQAARTARSRARDLGLEV
jgi:hypothetical protein